MRLLKLSIVSAALLLLSIGGLKSQPTQITGFSDIRGEEQLALEQWLVEQFTAQMYRNHLFELTRAPNVAGTPENQDVIRYLTRVMGEAGLSVRQYPYDVWLAEPGEVSIRITAPEFIELPNKENPVAADPYSYDDRLVHGWNAYSGSGDVSGEIIYANFGRREDFQRLARAGVDLRGKIVLARYGGNFRGFKAKYAEEAGAAGLIIFTDPANGGFVNGPVYPEGRYYNDSAIQRGSLLTMDYFGDPLTPFVPALPITRNQRTNTPRLNPSEVGLHTIPVAPIGYGAAEQILSRMQGEPVFDDSWQGGFPFSYRISGGPGLVVNLVVRQPQGIKRISNVVGMIEGSTWPDEWIILGSHFDAWGFGATDPNSGTAMLLTVADGLGMLLRNGVRPRRSILIAHWDAEEFLLIGSTEFVEQLREELQAKTVAYINADMSVTGPNFGASASPSLKQPIIDVTRVLRHPDSGETLYQHWLRDSTRTEPAVGNLGGGSDHVPFYMHAGIPSAGISISGNVPLYHTNYDTFHFYEQFVDSTFRYGQTLSGVYGSLALRLANAEIIPYDLRRYGNDLHHHLTDLSILSNEKGRRVDFSRMLRKADQLQILGHEVSAQLADLIAHDSPEPSLLKSINTSLLALEKAFLHEDGLAFGRWFQSLYASIDPFSGYASWMLPGLRYVISEDLSDAALEIEQDRVMHAMTRLESMLEELKMALN
jgi:N-acetylated-alpha-linked acidic dipeptidase